MSHAPAFLTLTRDDGWPLTLALAHIVSLVSERAVVLGTAHEDGCPASGVVGADCACPWTYAPAGTRINLANDTFVCVREQHDDIVTLINARMAAVIDGATIIAHAYARPAAEAAVAD